MKFGSNGVGYVIASLTAVLASGAASAATWPVWRGSSERTALVRGEFEEGAAAVAFRVPLGGDSARSVAFPPATPGKLLTAVGGSLRCIDVRSGATEWQSPMLQELTLVGSADLDGDGSAEAVAFTRRQAYVFSSDDGSVLWSSVLGEHSTISAVRLADVTGDGLSEVLIDDCATCGVPGPLMAEVVSFAEGTPRTLWTVRATDLPYHYHQGSDAVLLGLGDGRPVLALPTLEDLRFVDGATGAPLVVIPRGPHWFAQTAALVAGPEQVLLLRPTGNASGPLPPAVIGLNVNVEAGTGSVAWQYDGDVYATLELSETSVADLDGDGSTEVALSEFSRDGLWELVVLDAATGLQRGRFPGWRLESVLAGDAGGQRKLLVSSETGLGLATFTDGELTPVGLPLTGWEPTSAGPVDPLLVSPIRAAVAQQRGDAGLSLLVGQAPEEGADAAARYLRLAWAQVSERGFSLGESYAPEEPITAIYRAGEATRPYAQYAVGTTDGNVTVLDAQLRPSSGSLFRSEDCWWSPKPSRWTHGKTSSKTKVRGGEQTYHGAAIGGRQPARGNLIAKVGETPLLVVPNSLRGTVIADAREASLVAPPKALWHAPGLVKPSVFESASSTVVAGVEHDLLSLRDLETGALSSSVPLDESSLGSVGAPFSEPLLLSRDDRAPLIALDWQLPGVRMAQRGFAWTEEGLTEEWTSEPMPWGGNFFSSAGRYRYDAAPASADVLVFGTNGTTMYRRSDTGQVFSKAVYTGHYTLPLLADLTGDGDNEIVFQSGFVSPYVYGPNWAPLSQRPGPLPTYGMAGALVTCPDGPRYVTPFLRSSRFLLVDPRTGAPLLDAFAASGALFPTEAAAQAAGVQLGFLSNISALETQDGSIFVFGSTDGYLYAVDGCTGRGLVWALNAHVPLGEPSIGDWDGDGKEEILVGASSGHVLGIDFGRLPAPEVRLQRTSHGKAVVGWEPVADAAGYEYALVAPDGSAVWDPPYRRARGTLARVDIDDVLPERPFRVAVRGVDADGTAGSDGFSPPLGTADLRAPHVRADGDHRGRLWFAAADDRELDHYLVWAVSETGERSLLADGFVSGRFAHRSVPLTSAGPRGGGWVVSVVDSAGNVGEAEVERPRRPKRR